MKDKIKPSVEYFKKNMFVEQKIEDNLIWFKGKVTNK